MTDRILRFPQVREKCGISRSALYQQIADGRFPRPISLGARSVGWVEREVGSVLSARIGGASDDELRALVVELERERRGAR